MPVLSNARHERFAVEIAKGKSADEAYEGAGFSANRGNASRLKANESVMKRVEEIQGRAADRAEISVQRITEDLLRLARKGEELGDAAGIQAARASFMDAAKLNGLVIDKAEIAATVRDISDEPLTPEAWAEKHATAH